MSPKPNEAISMKPALRFVSLLAGLGCFLSGCAMVGPDYKPPTAKVATQWLEFEDPRLKATSPVEPLWWKQAFQDPVLDQLVAEALADNLTLRSAALRVLQARQQLLIAKGNLFPQQQFVGATAAVVDPGAGAGASGVYGLNFNVTWEIDVWGQIRRQIESVSAAYDATLSSYDGVLVSLIGQVAQTYLLIRTTEQRLAVARTNVTYQEESVRISQAKLDAGEVSSLDVEQGQTLLSNTRASVALFEQSLQQFKIALAILLGQLPQDLPGKVRQPGPIPAVSPVVAVGMPQDLIRRRPDIRTAERQLAAQSAQIGYAVGDLYPHFGSHGLNRTGGENRDRPGVRRPLQRGQCHLQLRRGDALEHPQLRTNQEQHPAPGRHLPATARRITARSSSRHRAMSRAVWPRSSNRRCSSKNCSRRRTPHNGPPTSRWSSTRTVRWTSTPSSAP